MVIEKKKVEGYKDMVVSQKRIQLARVPKALATPTDSTATPQRDVRSCNH
jgi:hypothetical protein